MKKILLVALVAIFTTSLYAQSQTAPAAAPAGGEKKEMKDSKGTMKQDHPAGTKDSGPKEMKTGKKDPKAEGTATDQMHDKKGEKHTKEGHHAAKPTVSDKPKEHDSTKPAAK